MRIQPGQRLGDPVKALQNLDPGILIDVGAAVGATTRKMRRFSKGSQILSFEPNPGNWEHFERTIGDDPNVTLHKAAVGDTSGTLRFSTGKPIEGSNKRWSEFAGGSSIGKVAADGDVEVEVVRLDDVIGERTALYCKIDVQGFETQVLRGMKRAIKDKRVKVFQIEYMQYPEIFSLLEGYKCFSQEWIVIPRINPKKPPIIEGWQLGEGRPLSTGKIAHRGWPIETPETPEAFNAFQAEQNEKIGRCWTDLLFVADDFVAPFTDAAAKSA